MGLIRLSACTEKPCAKGIVIYSAAERGLDTIPSVLSDITLLVAYIQIGFDADDMCCNQIFGFCPVNAWEKQTLFPPRVDMVCALKLDEDFDYGSWRLDRGNAWHCYFDPSTSWLCVGHTEEMSETTNVQFMNNAIAVLDSTGELWAVWMKLGNDLFES